MTSVNTRHFAAVYGGSILVGVEVQRIGPALQRKFLYDAMATLSPDEARRAVEAVRSLNSFFCSKDGRLTIYRAQYEEDALEWLSTEGKELHEPFRLGSDCWSAEFVRAMEDAIIEAEDREDGGGDLRWTQGRWPS